MIEDDKSEEMKKLFLIIDGNGLIHSSYHISKKISNSASSTVFFFLRSLIMTLKAIKCQKLLFLFDGRNSKSHGYRRKILPDYKLNRIKMPDDLIIQMNIIKELLNIINIKFLQIENSEADDLISSIVSYDFFKSRFEFIIWTRDKDMLQLIDKDVSVFKQIVKGEAVIYREYDFLKEYNFYPRNFVDYLSLMGDSSDNIKGIKGIGKVIAKDLISSYENIENIYANKEKLKNKIKDFFFTSENKNLLEINRSLIKLRNTDISEDVLAEIYENDTNFEWEKWIKNENLISYCKKNNLFSILKIIIS